MKPLILKTSDSYCTVVALPYTALKFIQTAVLVVHQVHKVLVQAEIQTHQMQRKLFFPEQQTLLSLGEALLPLTNPISKNLLREVNLF